jgi:hypothetical protein
VPYITLSGGWQSTGCCQRNTSTYKEFNIPYKPKASYYRSYTTSTQSFRKILCSPKSSAIIISPGLWSTTKVKGQQRSQAEATQMDEVQNTSQCLTQMKVKKAKLSLCLAKCHARKTYPVLVWGSGGTAPRILNLGVRWRWVVSFTLRRLYPRYTLDSRLGGPQSRSASGGVSAHNSVGYSLHFETILFVFPYFLPFLISPLILWRFIN